MGFGKLVRAQDQHQCPCLAEFSAPKLMRGTPTLFTALYLDFMPDKLGEQDHMGNAWDDGRHLHYKAHHGSPLTEITQKCMQGDSQSV